MPVADPTSFEARYRRALRAMTLAALSESGWPHCYFEEVPDRADAIELADRVRRFLLGDHHDHLQLDRLEERLEIGRFRVRQARLLPEAGGAQALLIPIGDDRFDIPVDPTPAGGWDSVDDRLRDELRRHRSRFLVAHELAHSFFFDRGVGGAPSRSRSRSEFEEAFCDEFARWLLVPYAAASQAEPTAGSAFALHRGYDVSVQLAVRALAAAHRQQVWVVLAVCRGEFDSGRWEVQWASDTCPNAPDEILGRYAESSAARLNAELYCQAGYDQLALTATPRSDEESSGPERVLRARARADAWGRRSGHRIRHAFDRLRRQLVLTGDLRPT